MKYLFKPPTSKIIIIAFLFLSSKIFSQNIYNNYQHYDLWHGLAQMKVHCVFEDKNGIIWIGTRNGQSKFNGENFTNYFRKDGLPGNRILAITSVMENVMEQWRFQV